MKKLLFVSCVAALGLAACSNDDVVMEQRDAASTIDFAVTSDNGNTRAADVYCNTNMPGSFKVYAVTDGKTYINGDLIENTASSGSTAKWENQSGSRYWPDTSVDFYAQVNGDDVFQWDASAAPTFANFTVNNSVAAQTDLMYAVKTGQTKAATEGEQAPVALNFHHALSQVVFYAKNENPNIYVEITGISVGGVKNSGTYTLPQADTDENIAHGTATGTASNGGHGTWAFGTTTDTYSVTFPAVKLTGASDAVAQNLTDNTNRNADDFGHADGTTNSFGNAMLLLPQGAFTALPESANADGQLDLTKDGVYFKVLCTIYNVADTTATDLTDNVKLWDNKEIYIPVSGTWNEGMKYIYTLAFGKGNGGIDPDGPKPALIPITYDVTVDEFIPISGDNTSMEYDFSSK